MAKPWERYGQESGGGTAPWQRYSNAAPSTPARPKRPQPQGFGESFSQGFQRSLPETKSLLYGAGAAAAGAVGADVLRDSALESYREIQQNEVAPKQNAPGFREAAFGDGSLKDWAGDTLGNFAGQALQSAAAGTAGALIGTARKPGIGTITGAVGGVVARSPIKQMIAQRAERMVAEQMAKGATRQAAQAAGQQAARRATQQIGGATLAGTGLNVAQETGISFTGRAEDAAAAGEQLDQQDALRALGAGAVAGSLDTAAEMFGVGRFLEGGPAARTLLGRVASGAAQGAAVEGATEGAQAVIERYGAQRDLTNPEAIGEYIDNAAAGALGGGVMGGAGSVRRPQAQVPLATNAEPAGPITQAVNPQATAVTTPPPRFDAAPGTLAHAANAIPDAPTPVPAAIDAAPQLAAAASALPGQQGATPRRVARPQPDMFQRMLQERAQPAPTPVVIGADGITRPVGLPQASEPTAPPMPEVAFTTPDATPAPEPRAPSTPPINMDPTTGEMLGADAEIWPAAAEHQQPGRIIEALVSDAARRRGRPPAIKQIAQTYNIDEGTARALRVEAVNRFTQQSLPQPATPGGEAAPAPIDQAQPEQITPVQAPDAMQQAMAVAEPVPSPIAADAQPTDSGPIYDDSPDVLDTDITPPSGGAFESQGAAELAARRAGADARVVPVDGGYVVRTPAAPSPVPAQAMNQQQPTAADPLPPASADAPTAPSVPEPQGAPAPSQPAAALPAALPSDPVPSAEATTPTAEPAPGEALRAAAAQAATSPENDLPQPTQAQKDAGNYRKGHKRINGLDISIENPAGSQRDPKWPPLANHYGYIKGTVGKDKDHVDVFMTDRAEDPNLPVFVVDQVGTDGKFDEHKVVMGTADEAEARATYLANYSPGWKGLGGITQMTQEEFKAWVRDTTKTKIPAYRSKTELQAYAKPIEGRGRYTKGLAAGSSYRDALLRGVLQDHAGGRTPKDIARALGEADKDAVRRWYPSDNLQTSIRRLIDNNQVDQEPSVGAPTESTAPALSPERYNARITPDDNAPAAARSEPPADQDLVRIDGRVSGPEWAAATSILGTDGRPARIYRGSTDGQTRPEDFGRVGAATGHPSAGLGVWFSSDRADAARYGQVGEYFLDIRNPKVYTADNAPEFDSIEEATALRTKLINEGHDGITFDFRPVGGPLQMVVFRASQIHVERTSAAPAPAAPTDEGLTAAEVSQEELDQIMRQQQPAPAPAAPAAAATRARARPAPAEPAPDTEPPTPKTRTMGGKTTYIPNHPDTLKAYFVPGRIVNGYIGKDKVISLDPPAQRGDRWSVTVIGVDKDGNPRPGERERNHATPPEQKELVAVFGPAQALTRKAASAPAPAADPADAKIEDFGQKIGGARKDTATSTGPRPKLKRAGDDRPAWAKRYEVVQRVSGENSGRWFIYKKADMKSPFARPISERSGFATEAEAIDGIALAEVARNHRVVEREKGNFGISREVTDRKRVFIKDGFPTRTAAMEYMAANPVEIIETKTTFGEEALPKPPPKDLRRGPARREGPSTPEMFMEAFGFRGVEFGNWNNQRERQEVMDHAYDGLMDMAEIIGVPPRALSLNGDLGLAFGARGQGLSGAAAHYERDYGVINLTKMKGAGSLAHEWLHALDHYLGRVDGKAKSTKEPGPRGGEVFKTAGTEKDLASYGFSGKMSGARREVADALMNVMRTMTKREVVDTADAEKVRGFVGRARESLEKQLASIRSTMSENRTYGAKKTAATPAQLERFDHMAEALLAGQDTAMEWRVVASGKASVKARWTNDTMEKISELHKDVTGRAGFDATGNGVVDRLVYNVKEYGRRLEDVRKAEAGEGDRKQVPTEFLRAARELDRGRSTDYWATEHELLARAFSAYIEDAARARGVTSRFLTYSPESESILTPWGFFKPYPAGQERIEINQAFGSLFDTIQTKDEGAGRVPLFSKAFEGEARQPPLSMTRAQTLKRELTKGWGENAPNVVLVETAQDLQRSANLPADVLQDPSFYRAEGLYNGRKTIWLNLAQLRTEQRFAEVLTHEALGHYGVERVVGAEQWADISAAIGRHRAGGTGASDVRAAIAQVERTQPGLDAETFAKEVVATMAEMGANNGLIRRVIAAVRTFLRKLMPDMSWSDSEIRALLAQAGTFLRSGRPQAEVRASRAAAAFSVAGAEIRTDGRGQRELQMGGERFVERSGKFLMADAKGAPRDFMALGEAQEAAQRVGGEVLADTPSEGDRPTWSVVAPAVTVRGAEVGGMATMFSKAPPIDTPEFKRWFGDSKVVDADGKPLVVYHGTQSNFDVFSKEKVQSRFHASIGYHFTSSKSAASLYASGPNGKVMPVYVRLQNPLVIETKEASPEYEADMKRGRILDMLGAARRAGAPHDGVIIRRVVGDEWDHENVIAFRPEQIKSATDNIGTFDPNNPNILFSKAPAGDVLKDIEAVMGVGNDQSAVDRARAALAEMVPSKIKDQFRGAWLGALTTRHLTELGADYIPSMNLYSDYMSEMGADRNRLQAEGESLAEAVRKWAGKNAGPARALFDLMHESTIDGVDPSKDYQPLMLPPFGGKRLEATQKNLKEFIKAQRELMLGRSGDSKVDRMNDVKAARTAVKAEKRRRGQYAPLVAKWSQLTPEAQQFYKDMRDAYAGRSDAVEEALVARINDTDAPDNRKRQLINVIRQQFETHRLQGVYFPLQRFGQFFVAAERDGAQTFLMFERLTELETAVKNLRARGFNITAQGKKTEGKAKDAPSGTFVADVIEQLKKSGVSETTQDQIYQIYLEALPELSMRKHSIHRKAIPGFDPDAVRAFAFNMHHGAHQLARLRYSHKLQDVLNLMRDQQDKARRDPGADTRKIAAGDAIIEELGKRHEWVMNPTDSAIASMASSIGFVYYLGVSPAAALVNLTQTALVSFPFLAARYGGTKAMNALLAAGKDSIRTLGNIQRTLTDPEEIRAHQVLQQMGAIDKTQAHNLAGIAENGLKGYSPAYARAMELIGWSFHKTEVVNRESTGMAAFRLARAEGKGFDEAVRVAADAINETHFDYTNANRARYMQSGAAKVLLMFRQYSLNMTWHLGRMLWQATKGESPEVKALARRNLAGILGMSALFSGTMGLPMMGVVTGVLNSIASAFGDDDEKWDAEVEFRAFLAGMFGETAAETIVNGVANQLTGADIAGRVSLSQLWFRDADRELDGRGAYYNLLEQAAGPMGGILKNVLVGKQLIDEGHLWRGVETMLPKAIKDPVKSIRYLSEGVNTLKGDAIIEDLNLGQSLLQIAGFTPAELATKYDRNRALSNYEDHVTKRRQSLLDAYNMANRLGDADGRAAAMEKIRKFNQTWPPIAITPEVLQRSVRANAQKRAKAEDGIFLNEKIAARIKAQVSGEQ